MEQDSKVLHFLKEFPDRWILFVVCIMVCILFVGIRTEFTSQLLNTVVSALVGLLIGRPRTEPKNQTNQTNIETDSVETPSMDNATINVSPNESPSLNKNE